LRVENCLGIKGVAWRIRGVQYPNRQSNHRRQRQRTTIMSDDINQEVLAELRKMRTVSRRIFYLVLLLLIAAVLSFPVSRRLRTSSLQDSWERVTTAMREQDFPQALSVAQTLVAREPGHYYGHAYLGAIYLATGDVANAEAEYSRAYDLFPSEENEKALTAIRKRLGSGNKRPLLSK
jgi:cytochrome c-type biogenesis protein CcmH/NrfG